MLDITFVAVAPLSYGGIPIEHFGTSGDVFAAEPAQLREFEIDQRTLVHFKALREVGRGSPSAR